MVYSYITRQTSKRHRAVRYLPSPVQLHLPTLRSPFSPKRKGTYLTLLRIGVVLNSGPGARKSLRQRLAESRSNYFQY